ncbi:MAG: hypothetical protein MZV64_71290 [Ignavibacteriales bacterium]|nr:hypothetical protein [Ignavibacteriales bacterium]
MKLVLVRRELVDVLVEFGVINVGGAGDRALVKNRGAGREVDDQGITLLDDIGHLLDGQQFLRRDLGEAASPIRLKHKWRRRARHRLRQSPSPWGSCGAPRPPDDLRAVVVLERSRLRPR